MRMHSCFSCCCCFPVQDFEANPAAVDQLRDPSLVRELLRLNAEVEALRGAEERDQAEEEAAGVRALLEMLGGAGGR